MQEINCSTINCNQIATMKCPICPKFELPDSYFCSQQCFQQYWAIHKLSHKKREVFDDRFNNFSFTGPLRPGKVSPKLVVPDHIKKPEYAISGYSIQEEQQRTQKNYIVNDYNDIQQIKDTALLSRQTLDYAHSLVKEGVTTDYIDQKTHEFIIENGAYPSPLNYYQFPKSICTSVNEVICHGIPDDRKLDNGDILNIDITVYKNKFHSDLNETYKIGEVDEKSSFLIKKTYEALELAQQCILPGTMYKQIGNIIGKFIQENGLYVTKSYTGHGIGNLFHCVPNIPHYQNNKTPGYMKPGHIFTIEPMINVGTSKDTLWPDNWTAVTSDGQRSAQFEHTYLVTETGFEILTKRLPESPSLNL